MKFRIDCMDGVCYCVNFPNYKNISDLLNDMVEGEICWLISDTNGVAIQFDKIISISEVRDK